MITFPNAKINIGLHIIERRSDNYHNLETVIVPIRMHDVLEVITADELHFSSSGTIIPGNSDDNLCLRAFRMIAKDYELPPVHIHLHKNIPIGAGLGGGSADAAFLIKQLNEKFSLNLTYDQMESYAKHLGADCSFFIRNKPALALEKGDILHPIALSLSQYYLVIVMPAIHVSTIEAYKTIKPAQPEQALEKSISLPIENWKEYIYNSFEATIFDLHPIIKQIKSNLYEAGALYASMSGSGAAIYGVFKEAVKLDALEKDHQVFYNAAL